ncbi:acyl-ACP thioesterase [Pontibacter ummariensis]|uniref:Acyl-ACP thioesterase n=1 Tax=Pontibacter ummariensis TaxID=1610492 RepID=A0A239CTI8_9BACT|nr:acyl-ACP thioesterase domain-containing protein [Pontibacter ummariensis]PRY14848.1 acyl-ACP thioesterase [Pontibacter ummariensis]SNS23162.1 Acyl-ACP thioesterase [Pontibacter ummariensis]
MKAVGSFSTFTIRSSEIDFRGQATLPALVNYMHESAWDNTVTLGISMYDLLERDLTWVLQRLRVEMFRYPKHGEQIRVETWASARERVFMHRDFRIYGPDRELLGQATSVWLVMDMVKRQLVSLPDFITALEIMPTEEPLPFAKGKLPALQEPTVEEQILVRWHDIDLNRHVTNTRFLQWALDTTPLEVLEQKQLCEVDIIFRAESVLGDTVVATVAPADEEGVFLHKLSSQETGKELVQAKTSWSPLE